MSTTVLPRAERRHGLSRRTRGTPTTLIAGAVVLTLLIGACVFAPLLTSQDPTQQDLAAALQGPSAEHPLGTDQVGRDVFARILYGGRVDLRIACLSVLFALTLGSILGCIAGFRGGWGESIIMRTADVISALPIVVLMLVFVFVLGSSESSLLVAIGCVAWVVYARIVRAEVLVARESEYVLAAKASGFSSARVLARHVLPNVMSQSFAYAMLDIVNVIALIVFAGYIGLGIQPPTPEWGAMIAEGQALLQSHWQLSTFPGIAVVITGLGFALLGDGLQDRARSR